MTYRVQFTPPPPPTCGYPTPPPQKTTGGGKKNVAVTACRGEESHILVSLLFFWRSVLRRRSLFKVLGSRAFRPPFFPNGGSLPCFKAPRRGGGEKGKIRIYCICSNNGWEIDVGRRREKFFMADGENSSLPLIGPCRRGLFDSNARSVHFGRAITTFQLSLPRWAMEATDCRWRKRP